MALSSSRSTDTWPKLTAIYSITEGARNGKGFFERRSKEPTCDQQSDRQSGNLRSASSLEGSLSWNRRGPRRGFFVHQSRRELEGHAYVEIGSNLSQSSAVRLLRLPDRRRLPLGAQGGFGSR